MQLVDRCICWPRRGARHSDCAAEALGAQRLELRALVLERRAALGERGAERGGLCGGSGRRRVRRAEALVLGADFRGEALFGAGVCGRTALLGSSVRLEATAHLGELVLEALNFGLEMRCILVHGRRGGVIT